MLLLQEIVLSRNNEDLKKLALVDNLKDGVGHKANCLT